MVSVVGRVERVSHGTISGWAYNQDLPQRPLEIQLRSAGRILARTRAHLPRPDLASLGLPTHKFGFELRVVPGTVLDLDRMEIAVFGTREPLPVPDEACEPEGLVEKAGEGALTGWARVAGRPGKHPLIAIVNGRGEELARIRADQPRPDLGAADGQSGGGYGFTFDADARLRASGRSLEGLRALFAPSGAAVPLSAGLSAVTEPAEDVEPAPAQAPASQAADALAAMPKPQLPPAPEAVATAPPPEPVTAPQTAPEPPATRVVIAPQQESVSLSNEAVEAIRHALGGSFGTGQNGPL